MAGMLGHPLFDGASRTHGCGAPPTRKSGWRAAGSRGFVSGAPGPVLCRGSDPVQPTGYPTAVGKAGAGLAGDETPSRPSLGAARAGGATEAGDGDWGAGLGGAPPGNCSGLVLPSEKGGGNSRSVSGSPTAPLCSPNQGRGLFPEPQSHLEREISVPQAPPTPLPSKPATVGALERKKASRRGSHLTERTGKEDVNVSYSEEGVAMSQEKQRKIHLGVC